MPNNNLADISLFESIQNGANQSMGIQSPMSVFNSAQDIAKVLKKLNEVAKEYVDTQAKLEKLEYVGKQAYYMYQRLQRGHQQHIKELQATIDKGGDNAQQAEKELRKEKTIVGDAPSLPYFPFSV
jgi:hypothetical protein